MEPGAQATTAIVISRDGTRAFLRESALDGGIDRILHVESTRRAIELVVRGVTPQLVLLDVDLFEVAGDSAAAARALRVIAQDAAVLEVGDAHTQSGDELAARLRGDGVADRDRTRVGA